MGELKTERLDKGTASLSAVAEAANRIDCLVCGGMLGRGSTIGLAKCMACGFISADLSISDERLRELYSEDYFHGEEYFDYVAEEASLRLNFHDRLRVLRTLVPNWHEVDLFEIGCAYGFFLDEVKAEVRSARGIDISAEAARYAVDTLGVNARQGDYLAWNICGPVDAIVMWDTIEHLARPDLFVAKAASDLKPGGLLALTTGDIGSLNARLRGRRWRMIHPPTHLHYFSVATLSRLLDRHGFEVVHVSHPGNARVLRSMVNTILVRRLKQPGIYRALASFPFLDISLRLNLFDIMYMVGRRG